MILYCVISVHPYYLPHRVQLILVHCGTHCESDKTTTNLNETLRTTSEIVFSVLSSAEFLAKSELFHFKIGQLYVNTIKICY